ncbi:hypothetical protein [Serratia fonticola]|uniref:hypothetical protein n=1 Tax=Serratia fonticola TaxID=47917 RepID=UPI00301B8A88
MTDKNQPSYCQYRQVKNPNSVFSVPEEKTVSRKSVHRHCLPEFVGKLPESVAARRFSAALVKHDWNRNRHIYKLRCERNQRVSVRSERREVFTVLALAMISMCDYNPDSEYLFEVMCGTHELARMTSLLHRTPTGRLTYDPILNALDDWEKAGTIIQLKGQDPETRQNKAMRIFIKPEWFEGLGFSVDELRKIVTDYRRWMEKKGLRDTGKKRYATHIARIARSNVASLDDKHSLKKLLLKIKRNVLGVHEDEAKTLISDIEKKLKETEAALNSGEAKPSRPYYSAYTAWKNTTPPTLVFPLEASVRKDHPGITGELFYKALLERIKAGNL